MIDTIFTKLSEYVTILVILVGCPLLLYVAVSKARERTRRMKESSEIEKTDKKYLVIAGRNHVLGLLLLFLSLGMSVPLILMSGHVDASWISSVLSLLLVGPYIIMFTLFISFISFKAKKAKMSMVFSFVPYYYVFLLAVLALFWR